jgi:hypothetical protein
VKASLLGVATLLGALPQGTAVADPLIGRWALNLSRTHYGPGVALRTQETFTCGPIDRGVRCTIRSVRESGETLTGRFAAAYDGRYYRATGIPGVDHVSLRKIDAFIADATFTSGGQPVFGYRAIRSSDGRHLTIVSVDPVTRVVLNSVVVYDQVR